MNAVTAPKQPDILEEDWQTVVLAIAGYSGWRWYHTHDSRRSAAGFPDLVLVRPPRVIFAELKTRNGRVSPAQQEWLEQLDGCKTPAVLGGGRLGVEVYLWRPGDVDQVRAILARRHQPAAPDSPTGECAGFVPTPGFGNVRICKTCRAPYDQHPVRAQ